MLLTRDHLDHPYGSPLILQLMQHCTTSPTTPRRVESGLTCPKLGLLKVSSGYGMRVRIGGRRWEY